MTDTSIYNSIATRTQGDIYIGVVGPVRTGKSTFIKRFMDVLVLPNMGDMALKERARDELPQSSTGKTIMPTEPKFIPETAAQIQIDDSASFNVRLIDCVGYIVPAAIGYIENNQPRMVKTPWFEKEIPFNMAAEIGTKKVITEHSTIGIVVTTDGTVGEIERKDYMKFFFQCSYLKIYIYIQLIKSLRKLKSPLLCFSTVKIRSRRNAESMQKSFLKNTAFR